MGGGGRRPFWISLILWPEVSQEFSKGGTEDYEKISENPISNKGLVYEYIKITYNSVIITPAT